MLPTKPLNTDYLHQYSRELALQMSNKFFAQADVITGEQILEFSNIKQINFLIIKILEERWEAEALRLESPFFDYAPAEVQEGLRTFLNILSRHIKVQKKTFVAVLIEAIQDTLLLVLDPRAFYEQEIQKPAHLKLTAEHYRRRIKYLQYNREIFKTFVGELALRHPVTFQVPEAMAVWHNTLRDHWRYIEPIEWRVKAFSTLLPFDLDDAYTRAVEVSTPIHDTAEDVADVIHEPIHDTAEDVADVIHEPIHDTAEDVADVIHEPIHDTAEDVADVIHEPIHDIAENIPDWAGKDVITETLPDIVPEWAGKDVITETLPDIVPDWAGKDVIPEPLPDTVPDWVGKDITPEPLPDIVPDLVGKDVTPEPIKTTLPTESAETISTKYTQERVNSLFDAIPLHEKFTFIDELFGGDNLAFQDALEKIDASPNYEEARRLTNQYLLQFNWDFDRESTQSFLGWLSRRF